MESALGTDFSDIYTCICNSRDKIDIWNTIPYYFSDYSTPLFFIVDSFTQLGENNTWRKLRETANDVVCDINGHISLFDDVFQKTAETNYFA